MAAGAALFSRPHVVPHILAAGVEPGLFPVGKRELHHLLHAARADDAGHADEQAVLAVLAPQLRAGGHEDIVEKVRQGIPTEDTLYDLTELFRIFGDSTRVRILYVLFESEMCVCDIAQLLGMTQSAISHQLRALKGARLVKSRRDGKTVFYSLADAHVRTIIDQGLEHVTE